MKIGCTVLIVYRIQTPGTSPRSRPQNSSLSLVKNPKDENEVFLIHHTAQNNGTKYKINDNIVAVFTKFLLSGKATIRLKEPAIDLCIECDTIQLKCFLNKLRLVLQGKNSSLKLMTIAASTNAPQKPKTKLVIKKKENYNVCVQLPRTLETVEISNVNMSRVDLRIFKLRHLKILNLEGNMIQCIPEEMGNLQIQELCLGSNRLGLSPYQSSWKWLSSYIIQRSLLLLKLDNNKLKHIPNTIVKLRELVTLKLDNNSLEELPVGIGKLKKLK
ncbi:leucine-rich repeat protein 1-like [Lycorma delicatula]|uniref:leucine-rich repeat protein 1-like n=1 Tax=Lycorma delicatula TaxID=130591 RepID=UPI003F512E44